MNFSRISKNIVKSLKRGLKKDRINTKEINDIQMNEILRNNNKVVLLDVRSLQEYNENHLNGAINIPVSELKIKANNIINRNDIIIAYCQAREKEQKGSKYFI